MRPYAAQTTCSRRCGMILVTSLWILGILTFLAMSLSYRVRLKMALVDYRSDSLEARALLDAGFARALWALRQDGDDEVDYGGESWGHALPMTEEGLVPGQFLGQGEPAVRWRVVDEGSKLNVNRVSPEVLEHLVNHVWRLEVEGEAIALAIADWTDPDDSGEAEENHYRSQNPPYRPRNDAMPAIEELLSVRGIDRWLLYGEDENGNGLLDSFENDSGRRPPMDNGDGELQPGLRDLLTVYGDGTVNVNTARRDVLMALFSVFVDESQAEDSVRAIEKVRLGADGILGTEDDEPFRSTQAIAEVTGVPLYERCKNSGAPLGIASEAFSIEVDVDLAAQRIACEGHGLVFRSERGLQLAYWRPGI